MLTAISGKEIDCAFGINQKQLHSDPILAKMSTFSVMNHFNADAIIDILSGAYGFDKTEARKIIAQGLIKSLQQSIDEPVAAAKVAATQPVVVADEPASDAESDASTTAPAKIPTAVELWSSENRERIASELPQGTKKGAITAAVKEAWKNLSEDEKTAVKTRVKAMKGKTTRRKKNPDAPKAPQNAFMRFAGTKRADIKKELENAREDQTVKIKAADVQKRIGTLWAELPTEEKKPFEDAYEADKAAYQIAKAEFEKSGAAAPNTDGEAAAAAAAE